MGRRRHNFKHMKQNAWPANGTRALPRSARDVLTGQPIAAGEAMVNFNGLAKKGRFFTYKSFKRLMNPRTVRRYRARGGSGSKN